VRPSSQFLVGVSVFTGLEFVEPSLRVLLLVVTLVGMVRGLSRPKQAPGPNYGSNSAIPEDSVVVKCGRCGRALQNKGPGTP